jgi:hypothetical protein
VDLHEYLKVPQNGMPSPIEIPGATRYDLPELFSRMGFTRGAEIGVWEGDFSEVLCKGCPGIRLLCVDCWEHYEPYLDGPPAKRVARAQRIARKRLEPYGCEIVKAFSVDAVKDVPDGSLDFVYIDGNHSLEYTVQDLTRWSRKVRSGGIVSGHDYFFFEHRFKIGVVQAVHAYTDVEQIKPWYVLGTRKEARAYRSPPHHGTPREGHRFRSYMWVKQ